MALGIVEGTIPGSSETKSEVLFKHVHINGSSCLFAWIKIYSVSYFISVQNYIRIKNKKWLFLYYI